MMSRVSRDSKYKLLRKICLAFDAFLAIQYLQKEITETVELIIVKILYTTKFVKIIREDPNEKHDEHHL